MTNEGGPRMTNITVNTIDYHRNGGSGTGFHVVHFIDHEEGDRHMMAVVFPPDNPSRPWMEARVAVFDEAQLPDTTTFGPNSWRGDYYAAALYAAIQSEEARARVVSDEDFDRFLGESRR